MSTYNSNATVYVTNNTGTSVNIYYSHEYSGDGAETWSSTGPIANGQNAGPLSVGFNTGVFYTGKDYWFCGVEVPNGPNQGSYTTEGSLDAPIKQCILESEDNHATLYFSVTLEKFSINLNSGGCTTDMDSQSEAALIAQRVIKKKAASQAA